MTYKQTYEYIYRKLNGKYAHFTLEDKDEFTKEEADQICMDIMNFIVNMSDDKNGFK